jgi:hypothetical protein
MTAAFAENLKAVATIVIIAYSITMILMYFIDKRSYPSGLSEGKPVDITNYVSRDNVQDSDEKNRIINRIFRNTFLKVILAIVLLVSTFILSSFAILRIAESSSGLEFADSSNAMAHFIFVGLQPSGEGQVHLGDNPRLYTVLLEELPGRDFELAREKTYEHLFREIRENPSQFAMLFPQKFRWAWQDDTMPAFILYETSNRLIYSSVMSTEMISPRLKYIAEEVIPTISQAFYISLIIFATLGILAAFFELRKLKQPKKRFNIGFFMISLYCFGFFLLLLIMEAQSRYKIMIIPFLCILAAYGFDKTCSTILILRKKKNTILD